LIFGAFVIWNNVSGVLRVSFLRVESLCDVLRTTAGQSVSNAADLIVCRVQQWSKVQEDDLTLLVCDYVG
jgi:hypothetical protein